MRRHLYLVGALSALVFLGAGCTLFGGGSKSDGGLFFSNDRGEKWSQRGAIPSVSAAKPTLANANIAVIVQDQQDPAALYIGTEAQGGYYSWDGGATWRSLGSPFANAKVNAIAVDPRATCTIYVAAEKKIYKTTNCARSWASSDFESSILALAVDPLAPTQLYAGNAKGDLLKSADSGMSWRAATRLDNRVRQIIAVSGAGGKGPTAVYAITQGAGIRKSTDGGATWADLRRGMESFSSAFDYRAFVAASDAPGTLLYASRYGLLRSMDSGITWQPLTLLTAPGTVDIYSLAVNPRQNREIIYATATTLYRSSDGGQSWIAKKLPTPRIGSALLVDQRDGNAIWMGTRKVEK